MAGDEIKSALFLCALQNAVKHGGVPQAGAVMGMVMGAHPNCASRQRKWPCRKGRDCRCGRALNRRTGGKTPVPLAGNVCGLHEKHEHKKVLPDLKERSTAWSCGLRQTLRVLFISGMPGPQRSTTPT